jgi:hypothetical protein
MELSSSEARSGVDAFIFLGAEFFGFLKCRLGRS